MLFFLSHAAAVHTFLLTCVSISFSLLLRWRMWLPGCRMKKTAYLSVQWRVSYPRFPVSSLVIPLTSVLYTLWLQFGAEKAGFSRSQCPTASLKSNTMKTLPELCSAAPVPEPFFYWSLLIVWSLSKVSGLHCSGGEAQCILDKKNRVWIGCLGNRLIIFIYI